jgi:hypothetical protein
MNPEPRKTIKKIVVAQNSVASHFDTFDKRKNITVITDRDKRSQLVTPNILSIILSNTNKN